MKFLHILLLTCALLASVFAGPRDPKVEGGFDWLQAAAPAGVAAKAPHKRAAPAGAAPKAAPHKRAVEAGFLAAVHGYG